jgi:formylglycine-generating enzyme required for sulfatase activity
MLVTRGQFAKFAKDDGFMTDAETEGWATTWTGEKWADVNGASWRNPGFDQSDDHPVVQISWNDAEAFCRWLSRREDKHYRLPTEAEWEYACRAGTQTAYVWGDNPLDGKGWANCRDRTFSLKFPKANGPIFIWSDNYAFTSPVGVFKPNSWGLYDMIGNASEWCSDWYGPYPEGNALDPKGPSDDSASKFYIAVLHYNGPERILRGGSWFFTPRGCRCANRDRSPPGALRVSNAGFRVVLDSN